MGPLTCVYTCGAIGIRTLDLFHAMEARYQLRHSPARRARSRQREQILPAHWDTWHTESAESAEVGAERT